MQGRSRRKEDKVGGFKTQKTCVY